MSKQYSQFLSPMELKYKKNIPKLERADIILIRSNVGVMRFFMRLVTRSYWDHVALVIYQKNPRLGNNHTLIIEAADPNGIEIHRLDKYLNEPKKYELGIARVPNVTHEIKEKIISFMLLNVDTPYYKLKGWRFFLAWISRRYQMKLLGRQRYCCSGFVQKAFYDAAPWEKRKDFIFREDFLSPIELQEITTPGDIAYSSKIKWIYNKH